MIEALVSQLAFWERVQGSPQVLAWFPGVDAEQVPLYLDAAPANAPALYVVVAILREADVLTQQKAQEYGEVELDVVVTAEDRGMANRPSVTVQAWGLAECISNAVRGDTSPYAVTYDGVAYDVTSDRIGGRSFAQQVGGTLVRSVATRYLYRVQRVG